MRLFSIVLRTDGIGFYLPKRGLQIGRLEKNEIGKSFGVRRRCYCGCGTRGGIFGLGLFVRVCDLGGTQNFCVPRDTPPAVVWPGGPPA